MIKLKKRDIYDFVCEHHKHYSFGKIEDFHRDKNALKNLKNELKKKDDRFILKLSDLGFGIKDKDPLEECRFYDKTKKIVTVEKDNKKFFSMLRPDGIVELSIRLYVKDRSLPE